jgi:hypothetical protein
MPFPNPDTQFQPGQSGNPAGLPKGYKRLSTWIQELANDEEFETGILDSKVGYKQYKGAPIKAIVIVALQKAVNGDEKAREWVGKYYGDSQKFDVTSDGERISHSEADIDARISELIAAGKARSDRSNDGGSTLNSQD